MASFSVKLTGWTYLLGDAVSWDAWYYNPATGQFIDGGWHLINEAIAFNNVASGGYMAVAIYNGVTRAPLDGFLYSTNFNPLDNSIWQFNLYLHGQSGDMNLLSTPPASGWVMVDKAFATLTYTGVGMPGWVLVDRAFATLISSGVGAVGWVLVDRAFATLKHTTITPPPGEGGIPWGPIAIGAGVVVVIGAAVAGSKKKAKGG